jgi:hypothetical protein
MGLTPTHLTLTLHPCVLFALASSRGGAGLGERDLQVTDLWAPEVPHWWYVPVAYATVGHPKCHRRATSLSVGGLAADGPLHTHCLHTWSVSPLPKCDCPHKAPECDFRASPQFEGVARVHGNQWEVSEHRTKEATRSATRCTSTTIPTSCKNAMDGLDAACYPNTPSCRPSS